MWLPSQLRTVKHSRWMCERLSEIHHGFAVEQLPARIITTSQYSSSGMSFYGTLKKKVIHKILLVHGLPNAQYLLALLDFYSPRATRRTEMSNPVLGILFMFFVCCFSRPILENIANSEGHPLVFHAFPDTL